MGLAPCKGCQKRETGHGAEIHSRLSEKCPAADMEGNKMEIREKTGLIIRRGNEYLVACQVGTGELRWSTSPWDAWITRRRDQAERIGRVTGGRLILFNPVAGQIKEVSA